jgi:LysM repeat protein
MKKFIFALASILIMISLVATPASAAAPSPEQGSEACTHTYQVKRKDNLTKIAAFCETNVAEILYLNPQIVNPNLIYPGQMLRITEVADYGITKMAIRPWEIEPGVYVPTTRYPGARVTVSATRAKVGDTLIVYVAGFPANTEIDVRLGKKEAGASVVVDGTTDSKGELSTNIKVPAEAKVGELWVVQAITSGGAEGAEAYSSWITIIE